VLKDGILYGLSSQGNLFAINAKDGKTAWTGPQMGAAGGGGGGRMRGAPNFGAIVDAGSVLIALPSGSPSSSEMIVFKPSDKAYEEVAKIKVADSQTYSHPILTGNKVIVKDKESVALLAIE
jgi:hypothetical protein